MMINKVVPLEELVCGEIFTIPHSTNWYMVVDDGYVNLDNGTLFSCDWGDNFEKVLLLYERLGDIILDAEEADITYLTQWWA